MASKKKAAAKAPAKKDKKSDQKRDMFARTVKASNKDLKQVHRCVAEYEALQGELNALETSCDEIRSKMLEMQRKTLPAVFAEAGIRDFTDQDSGAHLELDSYLTGTWPKEPKKLKTALGLLKKWKAEDLLKCELIGKFSRNDSALARKFFEQLKKGGKAVVELKERVHPQTLQAFFRERLKAGKDIPFDVFDGETGVFVRIDFPKRGDDGGAR